MGGGDALLANNSNVRERFHLLVMKILYSCVMPSVHNLIYSELSRDSSVSIKCPSVLDFGRLFQLLALRNRSDAAATEEHKFVQIRLILLMLKIWSTILSWGSHWKQMLWTAFLCPFKIHTSNVTILECGVLERQWGHKTGALMNGLVPLKEDAKKLVQSCVDHRRIWQCVNERGPSAELGSVGTLAWDPQTPEQWEINSVVYKPHHLF